MTEAVVDRLTIPNTKKESFTKRADRFIGILNRFVDGAIGLDKWREKRLAERVMDETQLVEKTKKEGFFTRIGRAMDGAVEKAGEKISKVIGNMGNKSEEVSNRVVQESQDIDNRREKMGLKARIQDKIYQVSGSVMVSLAKVMRDWESAKVLYAHDEREKLSEKLSKGKINQEEFMQRVERVNEVEKSALEERKTIREETLAIRRNIERKREAIRRLEVVKSAKKRKNSDVTSQFIPENNIRATEDTLEVEGDGVVVGNVYKGILPIEDSDSRRMGNAADVALDLGDAFVDAINQARQNAGGAKDDDIEEAVWRYADDNVPGYPQLPATTNSETSVGGDGTKDDSKKRDGDRQGFGKMAYSWRTDKQLDKSKIRPDTNTDARQPAEENEQGSDTKVSEELVKGGERQVGKSVGERVRAELIRLGLIKPEEENGQEAAVEVLEEPVINEDDEEPTGETVGEKLRRLGFLPEMEENDGVRSPMDEDERLAKEFGITDDKETDESFLGEPDEGEDEDGVMFSGNDRKSRSERHSRRRKGKEEQNEVNSLGGK